MLWVAVFCCITCWAEVSLEDYRETISAFSADPALVPVELPQKLRQVSLKPDPAYPDAVSVALGKSGDSSDGYVIIVPDTKRVVVFCAARPKPPAPMDCMDREEATPIATEFCSKWLPELSAEGGEVAAAVDRQPTTAGTWMVRLQRVVSGVNVPTLAEVGIRIYDRKVAYFRRVHSPLDPALVLPGAVTRERAQEIAAANVPWKDVVPVFWIDAVHEVVAIEGQQRNVWTLCAELQSKTARNPTFDRAHCWTIDAGSEEVVSNAPLKITPELSTRYRAASGPHVQEDAWSHPVSFVDTNPAPSPDWQKMLFSSTRERDGVPRWLEPRPGLFLINLDGTGLLCLARDGAANPAWSTDGKYASYCHDHGIVVRAADGTLVTRMSAEREWTYLEHTWLPDGRIVAIAVRLQIQYRLVVLDPSKPEAPAVDLGALLPESHTPSHVATDAAGDLLLLTRWRREYALPKERQNAPCALWRVKNVAPDAKRETVAELLPECDRLCLGPAGKAVVGPATLEDMPVLDLTSGQLEKVRVPCPEAEPPAERQWLEPMYSPTVHIAPDGALFLFSAEVWSRDPALPRGTMIWTCKPDAGGLRHVTPWEASPVPTVVDAVPQPN